MPQWATFVGITGVVLVLLLVLSHLTQSAFTDAETNSDSGGDLPAGAMADADRGVAGPDSDPDDTGPRFDRPDAAADPHPRDRGPDPDSRSNSDLDPDSSAVGTVDDGGLGTETDRYRSSSQGRDAAVADDTRRGPTDRGLDPESLSTGMVLANVAFSQGLFALVLLGAAVYTAIPATALGIEFSTAYLETGLLWGTAFGIVFYVANELGAAAATKLGFDHDEGLRELLSPTSLEGWLLLLFGVLPIIAVFEEFLFRAALIGVPAAGFGLSPWLLAVVSSIAFAIGHGMQGTVGIVVTGFLGFVLAAVFIVTGSLLVVVVAHYCVNALEFVVHEGFDLDWAETLEG